MKKLHSRFNRLHEAWFEKQEPDDDIFDYIEVMRLVRKLISNAAAEKFIIAFIRKQYKTLYEILISNCKPELEEFFNGRYSGRFDFETIDDVADAIIDAMDNYSEEDVIGWFI